MTSKETILTAEGLAKLEAELEELRTVKRLENEERLHEAIAHGDIRPKLLTIQKNGKRRLN